jgi:hypothetical protein
MSVIAGEISTGKTSILEFIDYCLGASRYPQHPEIAGSVWAAQLSIEVNQYSEDEDVRQVTRRRFLIERPCSGAGRYASLFRGDLDSVEDVPPDRLDTQVPGEGSLSHFLLDLCGLSGIRLPEAPNKPGSRTQHLSFRDVMPLCFLQHTRVGAQNFLYEYNIQKAIKLRQVVDLLFDVYDASASILAQQAAELKQRLNDSRAGQEAVAKFLRDQGVPSEIELERQHEEVSRRRQSAQAALDELNDVVRQQTAFVSGLRQRYQGAAEQVAETSARARNRESLLRRLAPLRAQYADDLKKLTFLSESKRLFDPLSIQVCPACASRLTQVPTIRDEACTLCGSLVPHLVHSQLTGSGPSVGTDGGVTGRREDHPEIDVQRERRSIERRLRELKDYMDDVEAELARLLRQRDGQDQSVLTLQTELDEATREVITPYIAQRDTALTEVNRAVEALAVLDGRRKMMASVDAKADDVTRLAGQLSELNRRIRETVDNRVDRSDAIGAITTRFDYILRELHFPKLADAHLDDRLIPYVRGQRYDRIGSAGAMTLATIAWELAVFQLAYERGGAHPGFLLIDSPQRGLSPAKSGAVESDPDIRATSASIVDHIYRHIDAWVTGAGRGAQVIVVDNEPPPSGMENLLIRYSADPNDPPYGLIEDATE